MDYLFSPFLLGVSTGIFCFTYCVPFIAPVLVSEQREFKQNLRIILKFILGRLSGYILFGAIFGYLGERISNYAVNLILTISLIVLSVILIFYSLGLLKTKKLFCSAEYLKFKVSIPFLLGFLMGINVCPPFLMSLAYVFRLHSVFGGIIYFLMFFLGTTIYFFPLIFLGLLGKMKEFRVMARIAGILVGFSFLVYGIYYIIKGTAIMHNF